ncbi:uncharacterized protein DUF4192 [Pseudonocardia kunmingensis]|uniref:Uncharacterized protein DUF4192 n=2 Tax=Pseudonocardia kunmingensis TaxID=630975 RepID=A0A543CX78_9PSEU|nr:uncharacterized protein DUF4192 [Pseudonocardia kunmingensis]
MNTLPRLSGPAELVAAVPTMLGFYPHESLVVVFTGGTGGQVILTARIDLVPPDRVDAQVRSFLGDVLARTPEITGIATVIISMEKRHDVAGAVELEATNLGLNARSTVWTPQITAGGGRWECCEPCPCGGEVPPPASTPFALASTVETGRVIAADRAALAQLADPVNWPTLARRRRLLDLTAVPADGPALLTAAARASAGPLDEDQILALGAALTGEDTLTAALTHCLGKNALAAEAVWLQLTRELPDPYAAHPAALLTIAALLRGDGALANIAVDRALSADPAHRLAQLLRRLVAVGIRPDALRELLDDARTAQLDTPPPARPRRIR